MIELLIIAALLCFLAAFGGWMIKREERRVSEERKES